MFSAVFLKTIPPRPPAGFIERSHLSLERFRLAGIQLIEVSAPDGFGKTSQLAQWHREAAGAGIIAMWLSLDEQDDVARLIHGLNATADRSSEAGGAHRSIDWLGGASGVQESVTRWLADVAQSQSEHLLILDDVDHLPAEARKEVINYLLANSANNLQIIISCRPNESSFSGDDLGGTTMVRLTARDLRFRQQETTSFVVQVLHDLSHAQAAEIAARVHAVTEGWPLGVRLAAAARLQENSDADWELSVSANITQFFRKNVLEQLSSPTRDMLVRIAQFDPIHRDLCLAVIGRDAPVEQLDRLADQSPVLSKAREGDWFRLHPVAREILASEQQDLPEDERRLIAAGAEIWYADHGLLEQAASQAMQAGDRAEALRLAEASLRDMLVQGRLGEVLDWYGRISPGELNEHRGFWAPAAWALALSSEADDALVLVEKIFASSDATENAHFEGHLILGTIAGFRDDLPLLEALIERWPNPPDNADEGEISIHATSQANYDLLRGQTVSLRSRWSNADISKVSSSPVARGFSDLFIGLSYLWEGKPQLAYESLTEALLRAEARMQRSDRIVSMIAAALAQACLLTDRLDEARLHLALRMPVIERRGLPETLMAAFCTLAELADEDGRQDHAEVQLEALASIGRSRMLPRVEAAALLAMVRFHAGRGRINAALDVAQRLSRLHGSVSKQIRSEIRVWIELHAKLGMAEAMAVSRQRVDQQSAIAAAIEAIDLARQLNRAGDVLRASLLRMKCREELGETVSTQEREEVIDQCQALGMLRMLRTEAAKPVEDPVDQAGLERANDLADALANEPSRSFLTPREHDILVRLISRMSNKEIALAMGLGEETVKWHLKNLFRKLEAGDRRSVVSRARSLGLV
jgi:LuxR family maltose regulon positive regulatory protein